MAHFGPDVAQQDESNRGDAAGDLRYPECSFPAVVLSDGAERESRQEATD